MGLLYEKTRLRGPMFRGAYEGDGTDMAGTGVEAGSDAEEVGQSAPGANGSPGVASSGTGMHTGGTGLGLSLSGGNLGLSVSPDTATQFAGNVGTGVAVAAADADLGVAAAGTATAKPAVTDKPLFSWDGLKAIGQVVLSGLGIISGTPAGVIGGGSSLPGAVQNLGTFSSPFSGSTAPAVNSSDAPGPGLAQGAFSGAPSGMDGDVTGVEGSPVLGFGGVTVNQLETIKPYGSGSVGFLLDSPSPSLMFSPRLAPSGRFGALQRNDPPAIPAALVLAFLASLLFQG